MRTHPTSSQIAYLERLGLRSLAGKARVTLPTPEVVPYRRPWIPLVVTLAITLAFRLALMVGVAIKKTFVSSIV